MFNNLIESKAKKQRSPMGTAVSVIVHAGLISAAVYATAHATIAAEKPKEEKVTLVEMKKNDPPPPKEPPPPPPKNVVVAPPVAKGFQVLTPPINIPDVIPKVDLSKRVTSEADFSGKGVAGGRANGDANIKSAPTIQTDQPYFEFQVEKQAATVPGSLSANYPEMLKSSGGDGKVTAQFVVDTTGRADMSTWKVLETTNELFSQAAKDGVRKAKFYAAEIGGKKVKQLVQLPFTFNLTK